MSFELIEPRVRRPNVTEWQTLIVQDLAYGWLSHPTHHVDISLNPENEIETQLVI